jgi:predicted permease
MSSGLQDAIRYWGRRRGVALACVCILGFGAAAAASMLVITRRVLLAPLPWPDAQRLVIIHAVQPRQAGIAGSLDAWNRAPVSWATWRELDADPAFQRVAAFMPGEQIVGFDRSALAPVYLVSSSFFELLGVRPERGRLFVQDNDDRSSGDVVISHEVWQRDFGGRPDIIGTTIGLASGPTSPTLSKNVIGVAPPGLAFQGQSPEYFLPVGLMAYNGSFDTNRFLRVIGRLAPGVSLDQALNAAEPLVRRDEPIEERTARVTSLNEDAAGRSARPLWMLFGSAGVLFLLSCGSVVGLIVVDLNRRRPEFATRRVLGATQETLRRQLSIELVMLAAVAGLAAVAPTRAVLDFAHRTATAPISMMIAGDGWQDAAVCLFGVVLVQIALLCALAVWSTSVRSDDLMGRSASGIVRLAVTVQLALAIVLLTSAGLFAAAIRAEAKPSLGFTPAGLSVASVKLTSAPVSLTTSVPGPPGARADGLRVRGGNWQWTSDLLGKLAAIPGVSATSATGVPPFADLVPVTLLEEAGGQGAPLRLHWRTVTDSYFDTMQIPIVAGRGFTASDRDAGVPTTVIVSALAAARWPEGSAIGRRVLWGGAELEIVGIAGDVRQEKALPGQERLPSMYVINFRAEQTRHFLVRSNQRAPHMAGSIRGVLGQDAAVEVASVEQAQAVVDRSLSDERFRARLSAAFGVAATLFATAGLFVAALFAASTRRRELAIRVAIGATPADLRWLLARDQARTVVAGLAIGVPAAIATVSLVRTVAVGIDEWPVGVLAAVGLLLVAVTTAAALWPIRRGAAIDPVAALKG